MNTLRITLPGAYPWSEWVLVPPQESEELVIAIDPEGCGCTECLTGKHVPLERASTQQLALMKLDRIRNNTGLVWEERMIDE